MTFYKRLKGRWPDMTRSRLCRAGFDRAPINAVIRAANGDCPFNCALLVMLAQKASRNGIQLELGDLVA